MSEVADILSAVHEIFDDGDVPITVDERGLGMAYAVPRGMEDSVVETYGPWHDAEVRQVFYRESAVFSSVLAEIQLIVSWRYSEARQYIIEGYLTANLISIDPTVSVKIKARFDNPRLYDTMLEAYEIPFVVEVDYRPIGSRSTALYRGIMRADGTGSLEEV